MLFQGLCYCGNILIVDVPHRQDMSFYLIVEDSIQNDILKDLLVVLLAAADSTITAGWAAHIGGPLGLIAWHVEVTDGC